MVKLNPQEIDKELEDLNAQIDEEQKDPTIKTFEKKEEETPEIKEEKPVETPEKKTEEEKEEEKPEEKEPEPTEEELKKKLSASARENQKILASKRKINQAIVDSTGITAPTDEEMVEVYDDWDVMSESERKIAKDNEVNKKWRTNIAKAQQEGAKIEKWGEDVVKFIEDPQVLLDNPDLEGKQDDFKTFATAEENANVPFKILIGAFLHDNQSKQVKHKGQMFPTGQGGDKERKVADGKISFEEGEKLKETNYSKWKELVKNDKIADAEL